MTPIIYESSIAVRFSELDPYGHVNSKHYLDYVIQSRWDTIQRMFPNAMGDLASAKTGFFISRAEIDFLRPIVGCVTLNIKSYVSEQDGSFLNSSF